MAGPDAGSAVELSTDRPAETAPTGERARPTRGLPGRRALLGSLIVLLIVVGLALYVLERQSRPGPPPSAPETSAPTPYGPYPRFAEDSPFYADVSTAPLDPASQRQVSALKRQVEERYNGVAALNLSSYAASFVRASESTARRDVAFVDCQKKGRTPAGLYDGPGYFRDVPIPQDAVAAPGADGHLAVWQPSTDTLWEFWQAKKRSDGEWQACWGGRIDGVSRSVGQFAVPYGVAASGLPHTGYMLTFDDARTGRIDHALGLVLPDPGRGFSYPATRSDGSSSEPAAIREGTRLRLDPSVDVDALRLTPLAKAIAKAAQTYGFIVTDRGGAVAVMAEGVDVHRGRTGEDPWAQMLSGVPSYEQLKGFPWERTQVIRRDWGRPG